MPLHSPNGAPRSLPLIAALLPAPTWSIVDVGARAGVAGFWAPMQPHATFVGFDPDAEECARLNRPGMRFLPYALADKPGLRNFHLTRSIYCHGFAAINADAWRFPNAVNNAVAQTVQLQAETLDRALEAHQVERVDFLKLDVEGTELDVLRGFSPCSMRVLGVLSELWFGTKDVPSPGDLDNYLRRLGFRLFDIEVQRYPRTTLPVGPLNQDGSPPTPYCAHGQVQTGDALWFRDPVADRRAGSPFIRWDDAAVLRLVGLFDLFGYQDAAIELLLAWRDDFRIALDVDEIVDALVPPIGGEILPFDVYWRRSAALFAGRYLAPGVEADLQPPSYKPPGTR